MRHWLGEQPMSTPMLAVCVQGCAWVAALQVQVYLGRWEGGSEPAAQPPSLDAWESFLA
jgi:hypothetical protein